MSNVFISHSSLDKTFVKKLAFALLAQGFPVWVDSWEIELGDSLLDGVFDGLESSSVVLLIVSERSNESGWVETEVKAALAKESELKRKFVIPVKIDQSNLPASLGNRRYGDFSSSFAGPLENLAGVLAKLRSPNLPVPLEREVLPLEFTNAVHLNKIAYSRAVQNIHRRHKQPIIEPRQVLVATDEDYDLLRQRLQARIDGVASDPFYTPDFESQLRDTEDAVQRYEEYLRRGMALMASHRLSAESAYWYSRILRGRIVYSLWSAQSPNDNPALLYGRGWNKAFLISGQETAEFFEVATVKSVDLPFPATDSAPAGYFHFSIDAAEIQELYVAGVYTGPQPVKTVCGPHAIAKFILPQMVLAHVAYGDGPIPWDLEDVSIGIH